MPDHIKRKILIIANPVAGQGTSDKFNRIIQILRQNNISVQIMETKYAGHGTQLARQHVTTDFNMIVAAGGDGTINEVINGITPHQIPLGIIPLGTANVLAKEINLPDHAEAIARCLVKGHTAPCWLGVVNGHYFALMVSVGLDSLAVAHVSHGLKNIIGRGAYVLSFLWQLLKSRNAVYHVTIDGRKYEASNVIVTNGRLYGGQYICAPDARLDDDRLYVLLAKRAGRRGALKYAWRMLRQRYPDSDQVTILPVRKLTIECDLDPMPIQTDGDHRGHLPAEISLSVQAINLVQLQNKPE